MISCDGVGSAIASGIGMSELGMVAASDWLGAGAEGATCGGAADGAAALGCGAGGAAGVGAAVGAGVGIGISLAAGCRKGLRGSGGGLLTVGVL